VQYECIKSELKEEYERKQSGLNKKLLYKSLNDPSYLLLNQIANENSG
jgi:hypothetical protein